ncbi:MAG: filamentous hemagglutinin N-terminal domain-containing protein, partial [Alphaproteobacteria bacterium]|nr:filamentous hemagglutinin N-terminal domain-containing protein [Alphaproteobacteria bacterium]
MTFDPIKQMFRWSLRKKGKRVFNICRKYVQMTALMAGLALSATAAHAAPEDGVVTAGSATITSSAGNVEIYQSSSRTVIEWGSFDIASGETVQFFQPGTGSIALNRITTSGQLTTINGNLLANGKVLVINPNGVLIGAQGRVDTAGFIASAADTDTALFMSGAEKLYFDNAGRADAAVENRGHITIRDAGL